MQAIDSFLQSIELRAFRIARMATHCDDDALDLVQDAMIKLVNKYGDRNAEEWKPLFLRILETRIIDWHRKETLKKKLFFWQNDNSEDDPVNDTSYLPSRSVHSDPSEELETQQLGQQLLKVVEDLPLKQQQCYLLRAWEGLSVKETAEVMGINANSVKSHYFRAIEKLKTTQIESNL